MRSLNTHYLILAFIFTLLLPFQAQSSQLATFAGGCFWCIESNMEKLDGVIEATSGYSDGKIKNPTYKQVSSGSTKHVEVVQVEFDPIKISYMDLLAEFWRIIDPTDAKGSFVDRGYQYHSAIYYHSKEQKEQADKTKHLLEQSGKYNKAIVTEIKPLKNFYKAEAYHQNYYKVSPVRYKFYRYRSGRDQYTEKVWGKNKIEWSKLEKADMKTLPSQAHKKSNTNAFVKPSDEQLKKLLTPLQYKVTQKEGTERPFENKYWDNKGKGIYVDIVSGEALFSSTDKFASKSGWPSFTKPIDNSMVTEKDDYYLFRKRTEIRSKMADSHLGHVFKDGPNPTGLRYCINSASLNFIPAEKLAEQGYEKYLSLFKNSK